MSKDLEAVSNQSIRLNLHFQSIESKSLHQLSLLLHSINQYSSNYGNISSSKPESVEKTSQTLSRVEMINATLDELHRFCSLEQQEKLDCFEQILMSIKSLHDKKTRAKEAFQSRHTPQFAKVTLQREDNIIQKLTDFMLLVSTPKEITSKNIIHIASTLLHIFFSMRLDGQDQKNKQKIRREPQPSTIEYCLLSGSKINLVWLIIFRILQKKQCQKMCLGSKGQIANREQVADWIENNTKKQMKMLLSFIFSLNDSHLVLKSLLTSLTGNLKQLELPIVPLFLNVFYQKILEEFKEVYALHGSIPSQLLLGKSNYSLEMLSTLCDLMKTLHTKMTYFQMKKQTMADGRCSYCGLTKQHQLQNATFQAIRVPLQNDQQLVIRICANCCHSLGIQPQNTMEVMAMAPLIYSRFWNYGDSAHINQIRMNLKLLLAYHGSIYPKRSSTIANKNTSVEIAESIAMNNNQQSAYAHIIQGLYIAFLFNHSKISLKKILYEVLNILLIYINSQDVKIREKTLKVFKQAHIIAFIFNQGKKIPSLYEEEVINFKEKFEAVILIKLRDVSVNIKVSALQLLSSIYSRKDIECSLKMEFYQTIYKQIAFSNSPEYIASSINIIEKSIFKLMKKANYQEYIEFVQIAVQTFHFSLECFARLRASNQSSLKNKICTLINKILQTIYQICNENYDDEEYAKKIAHVLSQTLNISITSTSLKDIYDGLVLKTFESGLVDRQVLKCFPSITPALFNSLMSATTYDQELQRRVTNNLLQILRIVFEEVVEARQAIYCPNQQQTQKSKTMFGVKDLRDYFFACSFFEKLLSCDKGGNRVKLAVLNELLSLSAVCRLASDLASSAGPAKILLKSKAKWRHCVQFCISASLEERLSELAGGLWQQIKVCSNEEIPLKISLIVHILAWLNKHDQISRYISTYQRFTAAYITNMKAGIRSFQQGQQHLLSSILTSYVAIARMIAILTAFTSSFEKIIRFGSFAHRSPHSHNNQAAQSASRPSATFENCYGLITEVLQMDFDEGKSDSRFQYLSKQVMLQLNCFWQLYPETIIGSGPLLKRLITNIDERGFIKGLYRLFLSLLPSSNARILSIINYNFGQSLHRVFERHQLRRDDQMIEYCFRLLQHMLKSGMTGLYEYNRYVYCGLMHPHQAIRKVAAAIITEIYANQASEKMLFANFSDSLRFIYDFYFQSTPEDKQLPQFTCEQIEAVRTIVRVTKGEGKYLLVRERRQLRMKPSFMKKISEVMLGKDRLLHQNPRYMTFLAKLVKCQDCFDYSELYEILFTVNKISSEDYRFIDHLRIQLEDYDQWNAESLNKSIDIMLAFREVASCVNYLSACQPVKKQLANYNRLFDTASSPFLLLTDQLPLSPIDLHEDTQQMLQKVGEDVELHFSVSIGAVECVPERKGIEEDSWSLTNETKPKAKKSRGKQELQKNKTRNRRKGCMSEKKRKTEAPIRKRYAKGDEEWSSNNTSLAMSEESIY